MGPAVKTVVPYRQRVNAKSGLPWEPQELAAAARRNLTSGTATYFETTAVFPPSAENEAAWASEDVRADPARAVRVHGTRARRR